ncbi:MAG: hypothetical protein SF187_20850 [Deltaproteobacteria bacterium]|nr:hypothetical protein [Deltaproteobacteria bacterium]
MRFAWSGYLRLERAGKGFGANRLLNTGSGAANPGAPSGLSRAPSQNHGAIDKNQAG